MKKIIKFLAIPLLTILLTPTTSTVANENLISNLVRNINVNSNQKIKNVILFIGDGMGPNHIDAGEIYKGSQFVYSNPDDTKWTYHGYQNTDSLTSNGFKLDTSKSLLRPELNDTLYDNAPSPYGGSGNYLSNTCYTDSAAGGTALATGFKTTNSSIGVDQFGNKLTNLVEISSSLNKKSGVVTTDKITGATPSSFLAHVEQRHLSDEILESTLNSKANLIIGERPSNWSDSYLNNYVAKGWHYSSDLSNLNKDSNKEIVLLDGLVGGSIHTPSLSDLTIYALDKLDNENGFFLMVEGSSIDTASHANQSHTMLEELLDFENAVNTAYLWAETRNDTLIIVTADHETGALYFDRKVANQENIVDEIKWLSSNHSRTRVTVDVYGDVSEFISSYEEQLNVLGNIDEGLETFSTNYWDNTDIFKLIASYL